MTYFDTFVCVYELPAACKLDYKKLKIPSTCTCKSPTVMLEVDTYLKLIITLMQFDS